MGLARGQLPTLRALHTAWGRQRVVKAAAPAEGAEFKYTTPPGYITVPISLSLELKTGVTVANRHIHLAFLDGAANLLFRLVTGMEQAAGNEIVYSFVRDANFRSASDASFLTIPLPSVALRPGYVIETKTPELKPVDSWLKPVLWVEEYALDGPDIVTEHAALLHRIEHLERMIGHGETVYA